MKFHEFFEKNYKLIKLNFILLGTLIFFLVLQLGQQSYAATETEITNSGMTVAEWTEDVLKYYGISDKDLPYVVYKDRSNNLKIHVFTDLTTDYILKPEYGSSLRGIGLNFTLNSIEPIDLLLKTYNDGLNVWVLDMVNDSYSIVKNFVFANSSYNNSYALGQLDSNNQSLDGGISKIIYTNFKKMWYVNGGTTELRDLEKQLVIFDYNNYIFNFSDDIGKYIKLDVALKDTDVSTVVFEGSNLMNNKTSYTISTSTNFESIKIYINDSDEVKITFKNSDGNALYSTTKEYYNVDLENFDYASCVIYDSDSNGDYITLDNKLKLSDVYTIVFQGVFRNHDTNKFVCSTLLDDLSIVKLYSDYTDNVIISMYGENGILWSNVNQVVDYLDGYRFLTFFEYYDTLDTINGTLNKLYYGKARMNFDLITGLNNSFDIRQLSDENFSYDFSYRFKYVYSDETTDAGYSQWFSVYDMTKNESGYYYLDLVYSNVIGMFVELAINVTDLNINETITYAYSTYSFSLLKGAKDGLIYWFDGNKGHNALGVYDKFNHISSNDVLIYDSNGNMISGVTSGKDIDFDFGFGVGNILDSFTVVIDTIKNGFSALIGSVNSVGTLFSTAFSWLPTPIPELIKVVFGAMVLFAIIKFIRG